MNTTFADVAAQLIQRNFRRTRMAAATEAQLTALGADLGGRLTALKAGTERQQFDITKSLGLEREQKAYATRLTALTDPATYAANRNNKWTAMTAAVKQYFEDTVTYLSEAGFGWDEAKEEAKKLTAEMAKIERMKLELVFPTNANVIGVQAAVRNAYAGSFNPAELTAAANSAGHIDAAAPKKRAPRKAKK
jgi:hypothetical protein